MHGKTFAGHDLVTVGRLATVSTAAEVVHARMKTVPDFPEPGILFRDLTPVFANGPSFRAVVDVPKGDDLSDYSITGVGGSTSHEVTCAIRVDGEVVDTQTAKGAFPIVSCVAAKP